MIKKLMTCLFLLMFSLIITKNGTTQDYNQWSLPEGVKARLGKGWITDMSFSPDGNQLAVATSIGIWIYNIQTGNEEALLTGHTELVTSVAYSPDGKTLASGSLDWTIRLWDVETRKHTKTLLRHKGVVNSVAYSPDGNRLATGGDDGIYSWDVKNWQHQKIHKNVFIEVISVGYSPDGKTLVVSCKDGSIHVWDIVKQQEIKLNYAHKLRPRTPKEYLGYVLSFVFSTDSNTLSPGDDDRIRLRDVVKDKIKLVPAWIKGSFHSLAFSMNNSTIVAGSHEGKLYLWDKVTGKHKQTLEGHSDKVTTVVYSPDGNMFATASLDGNIRLWGTVSQLQKRIFTGHIHSFDFLTFSPNGKTLASMNKRGDVSVWDTQTLQNKLKLIASLNDKQTSKVSNGHNRLNIIKGLATPIAYSPDGTTLAIANKDNTIHLWETESSKLKLEFNVTDDLAQPPDENNQNSNLHTITSLAFSIDGKTLVGGSSSGKIHFWDLDRVGHQTTFIDHPYPSIFLGYSSDSSILISGTTDGRIRDNGMYSEINILNAQNQQLIRTINLQFIRDGIIQGTFFGINSITFSPDGKIVVGASSKNLIFLWNTETGTLRQKLTIPTGKITSLAYSHDNRMLACGNKDNTISLWDVQTGQYKTTLTGHCGSVTSVDFSPDGGKLASISDDGTILLWDISIHTQVDKQKLAQNKKPNISQWNLPKDATARLGRGWIKNITYSPDSKQLVVVSTIGTWIYDVNTGEERALYTGPMASVDSVAFSPDGKTLTGRNSNELYSLDVTTGTYLFTIPLKTYFGSDATPTLGFLPNGNTVVSWSHGDAIQLWDATTGQHKKTIGDRSDRTNLTFSPDGSKIVYSKGSHGNMTKIHLWDVTTEKHVKTLSDHIHQVESLVYAPDGKTFASVDKPINWSNVSGTKDFNILIWDAENSTLKHRITCDIYVDLVQYSPNSKTLAAGTDRDIKFYLWDVLSGKRKHTLAGHAPFAYSPDGKTIASGSGNTIILWDAETGQQLQTLNGHVSRITSLLYSPDGKTLTSVGGHSMLNVWDVSTGKLKYTLEHTKGIQSLAYSPDGSTLATGGHGNSIRLWDDVSTKTHKQPLSGLTSAVYSLAYSPEGNTVAYTGANGAVLLWNIQTGSIKQASNINQRNFNVHSVAFSTDGRTLAYSGQNNTIVLWDVSTNVYKQTISGHTKTVWSLTYSPDGKTLASGSLDADIRLWEATTGKHKLTLSENLHSVLSVAFSPDGKTLASGVDNGVIHLWDLERGNIKFSLMSNQHQIRYQVNTISYSPDGMLLASSCDQGDIQIWNTHTGKLERIFSGHQNDVTSVAFSPDGKTLASGSLDGTTLLWDVSEVMPQAVVKVSQIK